MFLKARDENVKRFGVDVGVGRLDSQPHQFSVDIPEKLFLLFLVHTVLLS